MKVQLGRVDDAGCGHYRIKYPAAAAALAGVDAVVVDDIPIEVEMLTGRVVDVTVPDCDVFVLQRPLRRQTLGMIEALQRHGIAVVVDVDDDFTCIDHRHAGFAHYQPKTSPESNRVHLGRACAIADWVTVTTPALARRYGGHGRVSVLPNFIPGSMLVRTDLRKSETLTVGWPGLVSSHPGDLQASFGGVAMAVRDLEARFLNIGSGMGVPAAIGLSKDEVEATGTVKFEDYPRAVSELDVGIVPLADTKFNEAKSRLKGLEMAAVGVPFVASATPDYVALEEAGIGMTVKPRARSWAAAVKMLAGPEGPEIAVQARNRVLADFTYEAHPYLWIDAWEEARRRRAKLPPNTARLSG